MTLNFTHVLPITLIGFELLMIILYASFVDYSSTSKLTNVTDVSKTVDQYYPFYQDVHVMILIGFGFLMTFLKKYAYKVLRLYPFDYIYCYSSINFN